jgi:hypothetical protein
MQEVAMDRIQEHQHDADRHAGRSKWALIGFLLVAAYFLYTEHRAHVLGALPYLLLLACPLMHLFHHGHGHHGAKSGGRPHDDASGADVRHTGKDAS